jgi:hypothetical protein
MNIVAKRSQKVLKLKVSSCTKWPGPNTASVGVFFWVVGGQSDRHYGRGKHDQGVVAVMLEKDEFLQEQAIQCNSLAASAADSCVREFWLRSARRWLEMQRPWRGYKQEALAAREPGQG